ncbi:MAG TPA: hypothetical protein DIC23_03610 [Planctomycetaceae bacterium]|nr:hypothetical protein [Planctomycetaceae bacterium]
MSRFESSVVVVLVALLHLLSAGTAQSQVTQSRKDLVALWDFSAGNGTTLKDRSGHGHDGQIVGAEWVSGSWGRGLRFQRSRRNRVKVGDAPDLHLQPPYSMGVWFRTTSSQNNAVYLIKTGGAFTGCGIYYYGDSRAMYVDAKGIDKKLYHIGGSSRVWPDGRWHHVVSTCGDGKQRLFVDGKVFVERTVPADLVVDYSGTSGVHLGHWEGNGHLDATLGKAYILKKALTPGEVRTVFEAEQKTYNDQVTIRRTVGRPRIDGRIDEECWNGQAALDDFTRVDYDSRPAEKPTTVHVSFDDDNLYVAAQCDDPAGGTATARPRKRDDMHVVDDDRLEFFISTRNGSYHHLVLTAANVLWDRKCDFEMEREGYALGGFSKFDADMSWDCARIQTAVQRREGAWTAELAIPLSELGGVKDGTSWRVNVVRFDGKSKETSSFSPLFERVDQPMLFSSLEFADGTAVLERAAKTAVSVDVTPLAKTNYDLNSDEKPIVFANNYLARGSYTTLPAPDENLRTIKLSASLGEFEPATFSVRATGRKLHNVRARVVGDLRNERGDVIPASEIEIRIVELWKRQINSRQHMYMERFLEKQAALDIPRHTTRRFWLTVHVPGQAGDGVYRGGIGITADGVTISNLDIQLQVLPFHLQRAEGMGYFMYLPTWGIPPRLRTEAYLKRIFLDMRRHGMTTATLYPYGLPFENVMDVLRDSQLMTAGVPAIWLGADAVGPEKWKTVLDQARQKKWPELALYLQDEPGNQERIDNAKRLFAKLDQFRKQHPEHRKVRSTTAIGSTGIKALGSQYDIWIAGAGFDEELVKKSKKMDKLLWSYDCNLAPVDAESSRFYFGMWCWKTGIKGSALWAYADPGNTSPTAWDAVLKDVTNTELHYSFVRPTPGDLVPTIGWEAVREGVDDHRYLTTLSNLVARAAEKGLARDAERARKVLRELTEKIDINGHRSRNQRGEATGRRLGGHYDRTTKQGARALGDYRQFRFRIAGEIVRLQQSLAD